MQSLLENGWKHHWVKLVGNLYGPFLLSGIRVTRVAADLGSIDVEMTLRPWNRNYVGTHFGGSLFAMADPWFMIMLMHRLGSGYRVWDKTGSIRFRRPGRGTVCARFEIPAERVDEIRRAADAGDRVEPLFTVSIVSTQGEVVAEVEKRLSVRRRDQGRSAAR